MKLSALATRLMLVLAAASFLALSSCIFDKCRDVECLNGGTCEEGDCNCPDGYSGTECETFDPCWDTNCQNGGTCVNGNCNCPDGFEGDNCEVVQRSAFLGTWRGADQCSVTGNGTDYNIVINPGNGNTGVRISGMWEGWIFNDVLGSVSDNTINIPFQNPDNNHLTVQGTAVRSGNQLTFTYSVTDTSSNTVDDCTTITTRQ